MSNIALGPRPGRDQIGPGIYRRIARSVRRDQAEIRSHDRHAMAHLVARRSREIFRGLRRLHDRRRPAAHRPRVSYPSCRQRHRQRCESRRHSVRRRVAWRLVRYFWAQADVHCRDDYFRGVPRAARPLLEFHLACHLPLRARPHRRSPPSLSAPRSPRIPAPTSSSSHTCPTTPTSDSSRAASAAMSWSISRPIGWSHAFRPSPT